MLSCALATGLIGAGSVLASTFLRLDVPELIRTADRGIVVGRVLEQHSEWNEDRTMIWTEVTVLVEEDLAGREPVGESVVVRVPGGRVDGFAIAMQGAPEFADGERIVMFVTTWPDGSLKVLGYFQGRSEIRLDQDGRSVLVGGNADGMTLDALRTTVRRTLAAGGAS